MTTLPAREVTGTHTGHLAWSTKHRTGGLLTTTHHTDATVTLTFTTGDTLTLPATAPVTLTEQTVPF